MARHQFLKKISFSTVNGKTPNFENTAFCRVNGKTLNFDKIDINEQMAP